MSDDAAALILKVVGGAILTALAWRWLASSRNTPPERTPSAIVLRHPRSVFVLGGVCTGFFLLCAWFSFSARTGGPGVAALFCAFAAMGGWLLAEYFRVRHELHPDGIAYRQLLGGSGFAYWSHIVRIEYAPAMMWFVVHLRDGRRVRLSILLLGLPDVAQALLAQARTAAIDDESLNVLRATAAGHPPSIG